MFNFIRLEWMVLDFKYWGLLVFYRVVLIIKNYWNFFNKNINSVCNSLIIDALVFINWRKDIRFRIL